MISGAITLLSYEALRRLDAEAVRLRRHRHRERLRLGMVLVALGLGYQELGFRNFAAYVRERLSLPVRWCIETRAMARRLAELPRLRRALVTDEIGWAMAELLSRHVTPDDEEELLEACRGETVRAVRRILKERGQEPEPEPDVEDRFGALSLTMPIEHAIGLETARRQVVHVNGGPGEAGSWLECLLMEAHTTLLDLVPEAFANSEDVISQLRGWVEARRVAEARNVEAEERARPAPMPAADGFEDEEDDAPLPMDPVALDGMLRQQARKIASGDVWLGRVLEKLFAARAWERLGYATETQYALDRLGMSRSAVRARIRLTKQARWLDGLDDAIQRGAIGTWHATLIAKVADPDTLEAWIERAGRRTYKHLAEEVELAELLMRFFDDDRSIAPPSEDDMKEWERVQADWLSGAQMKRYAAAAEDDATATAPMLECGDQEPYRQYGAHIDEVEDALAAILRRRADGGAAVQMSGGSAIVDDAPAAERVGGAVQMSGGSAIDGAPGADRAASAVQMSGGSANIDEPREARPSAALLRRVEKSARRRQRRLSGGMASATIVARNEVVLFFRELEAVFQRSGLPGTFVELMLADFWLTWGPAFEVGNKWKHIHDRDLHQCTCPVCTVRKSLSNHHVRYRAHGGGDEMSNQVIACDFCHLDGEHGGRLRVRGTAERPVWILGRTPILRIEGREKIELGTSDRSERASAA